LFFLMGMYFTLKNPTNRNVFLLIFGLTTLYFASSMVRLLVIMSPAFALLAAVGVVGILKPFYSLLRESATQTSVKSKRTLQRIGKEYSVIAILIVFILLVSTLSFSPQTGGQPRVYGQAYNPITISAASLPVTPNAPIPMWKDMLAYTRNNLQSTSVVASWWDYGDWLGMFGNVTTLADNTTVNATQIENVGYAMMANETMSAKMLATYNASYVLVFTTIQLDVSSGSLNGVKFAGYGDEGKWVWMADISGNAHTRFTQEGFMNANYQWTNKTDFGFNATSGQTVWNAMGLNSTLYELMYHAENLWAAKNGIPAEDTAASAPTIFTVEFIAGLDLDLNTAASQYGGLIPLVALYKIDWNAYNAAINPTASP